jgi:hypothetical protein
MMAQRYFDLRDPVNQAATIGLYGQVPPPATPNLNHVSADGTYITWTAKTNLAPMRDRGNSCLKIYFIFLLIYSWYSGPFALPAPLPCPLPCLQNLHDAPANIEAVWLELSEYVMVEIKTLSR